MYFDKRQCKTICRTWLTVLLEPWADELILGIQGNYTDKSEPIFTMLRDVLSWRTDSLFGLIMKPIVLLVVLAISLLAFLLKLVVMLCLLPFWVFTAVTASIKTGLPDYPQTQMSQHD